MKNQEIIENFDFFLKKDLTKFSGKWVAIVNKNIVASSDNLKNMMDEIKKKHPEKEPLIVRAPTRSALIL